MALDEIVNEIEVFFPDIDLVSVERLVHFDYMKPAARFDLSDIIEN